MARTCSISLVPMPNTSAPNVVSGSVAIAANDGESRLSNTKFGADNVDDALIGAVGAKKTDASFRGNFQ